MPTAGPATYVWTVLRSRVEDREEVEVVEEEAEEADVVFSFVVLPGEEEEEEAGEREREGEKENLHGH